MLCHAVGCVLQVCAEVSLATQVMVHCLLQWLQTHNQCSKCFWEEPLLRWGSTHSAGGSSGAWSLA